MGGQPTCRELVELVTAYLDGALPETERAAFERHLGRCRPCRNFVSQVRKTVAALGHIEEEQVPEADRQRLVELFRGWKSGADAQAG